ncbi:speract receptor-like [Tubulanus polymorphus]|uniref:speract receptor-like n=1 Tax=Tubulanus polymorphus TaxID=672921 RepID=UPI003DA57289
MRDLNHENINLFVGACVDHPNYCLLYLYCSKGSLEDIMENDDIKLDDLFKRSLIQDLTNGLAYIHGSSLKAHGKIKSSNCVVSSRWVLKITDYGCNRLMEQKQDEVGDYKFYKGLWWTAPEILKLPDCNSVRTQAGDIYSFGIVLYEVIYRRTPYSTEILSPQDIVQRVRDSIAQTRPYRPDTEGQKDVEVTDARFVDLMKQCWQEKPEHRPTIGDIKNSQKEINKGRRLNIMDNMLKMMERYANNLEELVEHRTEELVEEKKKTDMLLHRMLPSSIAEKLKSGESISPEVFQSVTIFFSDIVKFTTISALSTPIQVVDLLNDLYTLFDSTIERYDVYKVETIGDAYMVVSGLPERNGERHAGEIAEMALDLLSSVLSFKVAHMPDIQIQVRIGIHTGSCCAGVVGLSMPRYCLFGDTVNTASRMESNGKGLRIHLSQQACDALMKLEGYQIEDRGKMEIKGKGVQHTYWLSDKEGFDKPLPSEADFEPIYNDCGLPVRRNIQTA